MGWSDAIFDSLTLPNTAGPGTARLIIGSPLPPPLDTYLFFGTTIAAAGIIYYSGTATNDDYQFEVIVQTPGVHYVYRGAVLDGAVLEYAAGQPKGFATTFGGSGGVDLIGRSDNEYHYGFLEQHNMVQGDFYIVSENHYVNTTKWYENVGGLGGVAYAYLTETGGLVPADPFTPTSAEGWHLFTLAAGWSGFFAYKAQVAPGRTCGLMSGTLTAGTKADGTVIATLPNSFWYRPGSTAVSIPINAFGGTISTTQPPHLSIQTNGDVQIFGIGTSTAIQINGSFPTDF